MLQKLTVLEGKRRFALATASSRKEEASKLRFPSPTLVLNCS